VAISDVEIAYIEKGIRKIYITPLNLPLFKPGASSLKRERKGTDCFASLLAVTIR
jgi:hypothetical protein